MAITTQSSLSAEVPFSIHTGHWSFSGAPTSQKAKFTSKWSQIVLMEPDSEQYWLVKQLLYTMNELRIEKMNNF